MKHFFSRLTLVFKIFLMVSNDVVDGSAVSISPNTDQMRRNFWTASSRTTRKSDPSRRFVDDHCMPSLFGESQVAYDQYAACLAATEGLRRIRDRDLRLLEERQRQLNESGGGDEKEFHEAKQRIAAKYARNAGKVLKALGMTVQDFNKLGSTVSTNDALKQKVMEQAYLYRMAAAITMDRASPIESPSSSTSFSSRSPSKFQDFCDSMADIEMLRSTQVQRLKQLLQVNDLPASVDINEPALQPFLSPQVQAVVQAFPLQAEDICKKHGLEADEFNEMLHETRTNPTFRWQVERQLKTARPVEDEESTTAGSNTQGDGNAGSAQNAQACNSDDSLPLSAGTDPLPTEA